MTPKLIKKTIYDLRNKGVVETCKIFVRFIGRRLFCKEFESMRATSNLEHFDFLQYVEFDNPPSFSATPGAPPRINWIVPPFSAGSGGHTTISRQINHLKSRGFDCRVYIFSYDAEFIRTHKIEESIELMRESFDLEVPTFFGFKDMLESDAAIATSWDTAYPLFNVKNTRVKFYFVQDYEPLFFPIGSLYKFAENTYRMGYVCITAGKWLTKIMRNEYHARADYFDLAYDPTVYYVDKNINRSPAKVAFYARSYTPRRGFEMANYALAMVKQKRPDVEIVLFGQKDYPEKPTFEYTALGILTHEELNRLYNQSTVGLVVSLTNYSLIPNEMMAAGLAVVDIKGDSMDSIFGNENDKIFLAEPSPYHIAKAILELLEDEEKRNAQTEKALAYVKQLTWDKSTARVEELIMKELS